MDEIDNKEVLQQWLDKANNDLRVAEYISKMHHPTPDEIICFLCQQSAEKYLKAFVFSNGIEPEKTHDLKDVLNVCQQFNPEFSKLASSAYFLTRYAVIPRYPNDLAITTEDAKNALSNAKSVQAFVLKIFDRQIEPVVNEQPVKPQGTQKRR